jgi:hypothetical protein
MVFPTLPRDCGREQHSWSVNDQCIDELSGIFHRQMLGNLENLDKIELSAKIDRRREVSAVKVAGIDQQVTSVDVGAVANLSKCLHHGTSFDRGIGSPLIYVLSLISRDPSGDKKENDRINDWADRHHRRQPE